MNEPSELINKFHHYFRKECSSFRYLIVSSIIFSFSLGGFILLYFHGTSQFSSYVQSPIHYVYSINQEQNTRLLNLDQIDDNLERNEHIFKTKGEFGMFFRIPISINNSQNDTKNYDLLILNRNSIFNYNASKILDISNNSQDIDDKSNIHIFIPENEQGNLKQNCSNLFTIKYSNLENNSQSQFNSIIDGIYNWKNDLDKIHLLSRNSSFFKSDSIPILSFYDLESINQTFLNEIYHSPIQKLYFFSFYDEYIKYENILNIFSTFPEIQQNLNVYSFLDQSTIYSIEENFQTFYNFMSNQIGILIIITFLQMIPITYIKYREFQNYFSRISLLSIRLKEIGYNDEAPKNFFDMLKSNLLKKEFGLLSIFYCGTLGIYCTYLHLSFNHIYLMVYNWFPIFIFFLFYPIGLTYFYSSNFSLRLKENYIINKSVINDTYKDNILKKFGTVGFLIIIMLIAYLMGKEYATLSKDSENSSFIQYIFESIAPIIFIILLIFGIIYFLFSNSSIQLKIQNINLYITNHLLKISNSLQKIYRLIRNQSHQKTKSLFLKSSFLIFIFSGLCLNELSNTVDLEQKKLFLDLDLKIVFNSQIDEQSINSILHQFNISSYYSYREFNLNFKYRPDLAPLKAIAVNMSQYNACNIIRNNNYELTQEKIYINKNLFRGQLNTIQNINDLIFHSKNSSYSINLAKENTSLVQLIPGLIISYENFPMYDVVCDISYFERNFENDSLNISYIIGWNNQQSFQQNFLEEIQYFEDFIVNIYSYSSFGDSVYGNTLSDSFFRFIREWKFLFLIIAIIQITFTTWYQKQDLEKQNQWLISRLVPYGIDKNRIKMYFFLNNSLNLIMNIVVYAFLLFIILIIFYIVYFTPQSFYGEYYFSLEFFNVLFD